MNGLDFYRKAYISIFILLLFSLFLNGCAPFLLGYLFPGTYTHDSHYSDSDMVNIIFVWTLIIFGLFFMWLSWKLATDKGRNPWIWTALSFLLSFLPPLILYNLEDLSKKKEPEKAGTLYHAQKGVVRDVDETVPSESSKSSEIDMLRELLGKNLSITEFLNELKRIGFKDFEHTPFGTVCNGKSGRLWFFAGSSSGKVSQAKYLDSQTGKEINLLPDSLPLEQERRTESEQKWKSMSPTNWAELLASLRELNDTIQRSKSSGGAQNVFASSLFSQYPYQILFAILSGKIGESSFFRDVPFVPITNEIVKKAKRHVENPSLPAINAAMGFKYPSDRYVITQRGEIGKHPELVIDGIICQVASCLSGRKGNLMDPAIAGKLAHDAVVHYADIPIVYYFFALPYLETAMQTKEISPLKALVTVYKGIEGLILEIYDELKEGEVITDQTIINKVKNFFSDVKESPRKLLQKSTAIFNLWVKDPNPSKEYLITLLLKICKEKPNDVPDEFLKYQQGDSSRELSFHLSPNIEKGGCDVEFTLS